jgi:protein phosphatase
MVLFIGEDRVVNDSISLKDILARDRRLIRLPTKGKAVFAGDTHGDIDATEKIFRGYFKPGYVLIFLGDYVDRGPNSRDNIEFLIEKKLEAPEQVFLLAGNHEGYSSIPFKPADFWEGLSPYESEYFSEIFSFFSFAAATENGIIAVHGVPPDVKNMQEIDTIEIGSDNWIQLTWGDCTEKKGELLSNPAERPKYGEDYFTRVMKQLGMNILIRSHQPRIKPVVYDKRCLTLMTSRAYTQVRIIAIADLEKPAINSVDDLEIREI